MLAACASFPWSLAKENEWPRGLCTLLIPAARDQTSLRCGFLSGALHTKIENLAVGEKQVVKQGACAKGESVLAHDPGAGEDCGELVGQLPWRRSEAGVGGTLSRARLLPGREYEHLSVLPQALAELERS